MENLCVAVKEAAKKWILRHRDRAMIYSRIMKIIANLVQSLSNESLIKFAHELGTPLYVYDGDLIVEKYKEFHAFIKYPKLRIYYAMKANYNPAVLRLLKDINAFLDVVSPAEAHLVLKLGFSKDSLLYTANNITDEEMHEVKQMGLLFNIGSLSRLEKYGQAYPGTSLCLRFNPDVVAGENEKVQTGGDLTKFGILLQDIDKVEEITKKHELRVIGLHKHTGSGISDTEKFIQSMKNLLSIAKKEIFPELEFVDFGGGFKVPYEPDEKRIDYEAFGEQVSGMFSNFCKDYGKELYFYFEPGKYIVSEAGYLLIRVNTLKDNNGRLIAGTNSGFPQLTRPMFYQAYHHILNLSNPNGEKRKYDVCGNICETGDCFAFQRELPEIREGDLLAIQNAGAYCYSMGSTYNLRPVPSEAIVIKGKAKLVTERLTNQALADEIINKSK
jgi:diaminopimelate decarboxylase